MSNISGEEFQRQTREIFQANKAFFEVNSEKAEEVIKRGNTAFAKIWPKDEPSDCVELEQQIKEDREQSLAPFYAFIKIKYIHDLAARTFKQQL